MFRLKSVYIKDYKNIQDQTFDFSSNTGYIALIGLNGSGKSNLLEAISLIFNELYNIKHSEYDNVKGYRITYEIDGTSYTYTTLDEHNNIIPLDKGDRIFPSSVIACYSGEDPRLWSMAYRPYYLGFFSNALHGKDYVPKTMYINKYCWKIALISLLFSLDRDVQQFVKNVLHIDVKNVTIQFTYNDIENPQPHDAYNWLNRVKKKFGVDKIKFTDLRDFGLENIKHMDLTEDKLIFYYLYFLHLPKKTPNQPIDKLISTISIKLDSIEFDSLSEGQKKMILIACITRILGDENSLVLLDEPDVHTHIARKKNLLEMIEIFNGQTILTTHAPVFVNEIYKREKNNLFFVEKGAFAKSDYINQLITLSSGEIDFLNGSIVLSAKNILVTEGPYDKRYLEKAIEIFCKKDEKYKLLHQVAIIPSNSAGNADAFYEQVLLPQIDKYNKIVFIFDYDEGGYSGWKKIKARREDKLEALFYQQNYSNTLETSNPPSKVNYILVEDFFAAKSYKTKVEEVHLERKKTHKDFRIWTANLSSTIKTYIEGNYSNFADDDYDDFKSILDKLIDIFNL